MLDYVCRCCAANFVYHLLLGRKYTVGLSDLFSEKSAAYCQQGLMRVELVERETKTAKKISRAFVA